MALSRWTKSKGHPFVRNRQQKVCLWSRIVIPVWAPSGLHELLGFTHALGSGDRPNGLGSIDEAMGSAGYLGLLGSRPARLVTRGTGVYFACLGFVLCRVWTGRVAREQYMEGSALRQTLNEA